LACAVAAAHNPGLPRRLARQSACAPSDAPTSRGSTALGDGLATLQRSEERVAATPAPLMAEAAVFRGQLRLAVLIRVEHEDDRRAGRIRVDIELVGLQRPLGEDVALVPHQLAYLTAPPVK